MNIPSLFGGSHSENSFRFWAFQIFDLSNRLLRNPNIRALGLFNEDREKKKWNFGIFIKIKELSFAGNYAAKIFGASLLTKIKIFKKNS